MLRSSTSQLSLGRLSDWDRKDLSPLHFADVFFGKRRRFMKIHEVARCFSDEIAS